MATTSHKSAILQHYNAKKWQKWHEKPATKMARPLMIRNLMFHRNMVYIDNLDQSIYKPIDIIDWLDSAIRVGYVVW